MARIGTLALERHVPLRAPTPAWLGTEALRRAPAWAEPGA